MGKVDCLEIDGCQCWFWSHDHRPPHFHVKRAGEWEYQVFFHEEPPYMEQVWAVKRIPGRLQREILRSASEHRSELFVEWSRKVIPDER